jgi:hypothetical protein
VFLIACEVCLSDCCCCLPDLSAVRHAERSKTAFENLKNARGESHSAVRKAAHSRVDFANKLKQVCRPCYCCRQLGFHAVICDHVLCCAGAVCAET